MRGLYLGKGESQEDRKNIIKNKIIDNALKVVSGKFGEVLKEWTETEIYEQLGDIKIPYFIIFDGRKPRILKAISDGIAEKNESSEWVYIKE